MFWDIALLVAISGAGFVAWVWQRYLRIVVNLFLGVVVRTTPNDEQRFEGEEVTLRTADGVELAATLAVPEGKRHSPVVIFCSEFGADRRSAGPYAEWLLGAGYAVFAFDFRGHGDSKNTDDYVPRQWATDRELTDLEAAVAYVRRRDDLDGESLVLFGISRGAAVATAFASRDSGVRALVTDGLFSTERTLVEYMRRWVSIFADVRLVYSHLPNWVFSMYEKLTLLVSELRLGVRFLSVEKAVRQRRCPLLMIHGEADSYIDASQARWLHEQANPPKTLWVVAGSAHNQSVAVAGELYHQRVLEFIAACLPTPAPAPVHSSTGKG